MKTTRIFALCYLVILSVSPALASSSISFSEAKDLASSTNKNIFVNYTADWCLPCQIFKDQVLSDSKVNQLLDSEFVVLTADYDDIESKEMYDDFAIACMPTLHILDDDGEVLSEMSGTMTAAQFYAELSLYSKNTISEEKQTETRPIPVASSMTKKIAPSITEYYTLQSGAFSSWDNATSMKKKIENMNMSSSIRIVEDTQRKLYIVNVGKYGTKEELLSTSERLKEAGIDHFVKRKKEINALLDKGI